MPNIDKEQAVRTAAETLHTAIADAKAAGLVTRWPRTVDGLMAIAISETAAAEPAEAPVVAAAPVSTIVTPKPSAAPVVVKPTPDQAQ